MFMTSNNGDLVIIPALLQPHQEMESTNSFSDSQHIGPNNLPFLALLFPPLTQQQTAGWSWPRTPSR